MLSHSERGTHTSCVLSNQCAALYLYESTLEDIIVIPFTTYLF